MRLRFRPTFFISLSWQVTQYLSTTAETSGDNEVDGAAGRCCAAKQWMVASKADVHRTRIPPRIFSATHRPMGFGRFTAAQRLTAQANRDKCKGMRRESHQKAQTSKEQSSVAVLRLCASLRPSTIMSTRGLLANLRPRPRM